MTEKNLKCWIGILALLLGIMSGLSVFNPIVRNSLLQDGVLSETYYRSAKWGEERGDLKGAKHDYEFALWLNPYHKEAKEALRRFGKK